MPKRFRVFLIMLFAAGCSIPQKQLIIDSATIDFFNAFQEKYPNQIDNLIMVFENMIPSKLGTCAKGDYTPYISLNREQWKKLNYWGKRELVMHEMGHCVLNKPHNDTHINIMNSFHLGDYYYNEKTYHILEDELFNN